jgi:hypothetical protein
VRQGWATKEKHTLSREKKAIENEWDKDGQEKKIMHFLEMR